VKLPLVVIVWDDAWVRAEESVAMGDVHATHKPMSITTIGWLLLENEDGISVANEYYDDTYRGRTFIPRAMVKSVTRFALTKPRLRKGRPLSAED
jgi:hypothetical protein